MQDLHRALADIGEIRARLARESAFQGYGPAAIAVTGGLALGLAAAQAAVGEAALDPAAYFGAWVALAVAGFALVGAEAVTRARRLHSGLADEMIAAAAAAFAPAGVAGLSLALVLARFAPDGLWLLPGLWAVLVGLGVFASARSLPEGAAFAGAWYLLAGLATLAAMSGTRDLSPWAMGVPFGAGQLLLAALLHRALGRLDDPA